MNIRRTRLALLLFAGITLAGCASGSQNLLSADAPRSLPNEGPVAVRWEDPAQFSELRSSGNRDESARGEWLTELAKYLRKRAEAQLSAGERLELTIVDVQRAGRYEPWHSARMENVRVVRDTYPPRMTVKFARYDASGALVAEGERTLTDPAFLLGSSPIKHTDPLRYEKRMIDDWLRTEDALAAH